MFTSYMCHRKIKLFLFKFVNMIKEGHIVQQFTIRKNAKDEMLCLNIFVLMGRQFTKCYGRFIFVQLIMVFAKYS